MDRDLVFRKPGRFRGDRLRARNDLRSHPDVTGNRRDMDGAVQRLHRRVGKEWHLVGGVIALAKIEDRSDISDGFCEHAMTFACGAKMVPYVLGADRSVLAFIPGD